MAQLVDPYVLRADARVHTADIRFVSSTPNGCVLTASRDATAQLSCLPEKGVDTVTPSLTFVGHQAFVNFAIFHPGVELLGGLPCLVTGSNDTHVALWDLQTSAVEAILDGHTHGVCCGIVVHGCPSNDGDIITGDWGGKCIVFSGKSGRPQLLYEQHATAVRGIAQLPGTTSVVTCSGDKTIHLWDIVSGATKKVFKGHEDVVQCICAIDSSNFATSGNDCSIRIWAVDRDVACCVLQGHDSLVYSLAWNPATRELLSASEDRSAKVWGHSAGTSHMGLIQSISHPCVVWGVSVLEGGEIATAGSDGFVRIWTRDGDCAASPDKLEALEAAISSQSIDIKTTGGLDISSMISVDEIHLKRGSVVGEKLFAKNDAGAVEVFFWDGSRWEKVGTVVSGPGQQPYTGQALPREKHHYQGKEYDYLFSVDVEGKPLKLPYNAGDSVFEAAQRFIDDHQGIVTQDSKEEIQQFIMKNIDPQDVNRIPGLQGASSMDQPPRKTPHYEERVAQIVAPWDTHSFFDSFNADGAQRKVSELLLGCPEASKVATVMGDVARCVSGGECEQVIHALRTLFDALPLGSRFPALDAFRYCLSRPNPRMDRLVLAFVAAKLTAGSLQGDSEYLTALRLGSNLFASLSETRPTSLSSEECASLLFLAKQLPSSVIRSPKATVKSSIDALMRNVVVFVRSQACRADLVDFLASLSCSVIALSSQLLVMEPAGSSLTPTVLRTLLTLYSVAANAPWKEGVISDGRKLLLFSLRAIQSGVVEDIQGVATAIIDALA